MPLPDANKRNLRLPRELAARLKKEAAAQGASENYYVIQAITQKLDADEARRAQRANEGQKHRRDRDHEAPRGLGLRLEPLSRTEPVPVVEPTAPVVVNVGGPTGPKAAGESGLVAGLCAHIAAGPPWELERRHQGALEILRSACSTPEARREAEGQLKEAVAERLRERRPSASIGHIGSLFPR